MSSTVTTKPSGRSFSVQDGETVLDAALRQGIALPYGCRDGHCGSCTATLLAGDVDYPGGLPEALVGRPQATCLTCLAVPKSDLQLGVDEAEAASGQQIFTLASRVERVERVGADVMRLFLRLAANRRVPYLAGQYLDILLRDGRRRAYSIANAPEDDALIELHIRQVPGGEFSEYVFNRLEERAILRVKMPLGSFILREKSTRPLLFVCAGTGFAPIKAMIEHLVRVGSDRPAHLYWGVKTRHDAYLAELPERWARELPWFNYTLVLSEPDSEWRGRRGHVHQAVLARRDLVRHDVYMSGPPAMVRAGRSAFVGVGLGVEHIHSDAFEYARDRSGD